jgi:hypothetical protein
MVGRENSNLMKNYKHLKSVSRHGWKIQPPLETFSREGLGTPPVSRNQSHLEMDFMDGLMPTVVSRDMHIDGSSSHF